MLLSALGFLMGVLVMGYLSMIASKSFLEIVSLNYQMEEHIKAIRAKENADMANAVIHYKNLIEASSPPGLYCFSDKRDLWSLGFPFMAVVLGQISKPIPAEGAKKREAMNRAMLADAMEKAGDKKAATAEYAKAADLFGFDANIERVRKIVQEVISSDNAILTLEKQYTYPKGN